MDSSDSIGATNSRLSLAQHREAGHALMRSLAATEREAFLEQQGKASKRADPEILSLISEFQAPFLPSPPTMLYEHAFQCDWHKTCPELYNARHWICDHNAGVYFIYDDSEDLKYIGAFLWRKSGQ